MMVSLLINLLLVALIFGLGWYLSHVLPLPHPVPLVVRIELILILIILIIDFLVLPPNGTTFIKNAPENREVFSLADEWRGFRYDK
jgi:hypothetical protein